MSTSRNNVCLALASVIFTIGIIGSATALELPEQQPDDSPALGKVNLVLYYESLCPGCSAFITGEVSRAHKSIPELFSLEFVPYGNAHESKEEGGAVSCQHGERECLGNKIHACAIHVFSNAGKDAVNNITPFILCMENEWDRSDHGEKCAKKLNLDPNGDIGRCVKNDRLSNKLIHINAVRTSKLSPPHNYVPWLTVKDAQSKREVHNEEDQEAMMEDLVQFICQRYAFQDALPAACKQQKASAPELLGKANGFSASLGEYFHRVPSLIAHVWHNAISLFRPKESGPVANTVCYQQH
eukprot:Nk52_evm22s367 gene=Nk52_evmTU22s367